MVVQVVGLYCFQFVAKLVTCGCAQEIGSRGPGVRQRLTFYIAYSNRYSASPLETYIRSPWWTGHLSRFRLFLRSSLHSFQGMVEGYCCPEFISGLAGQGGAARCARGRFVFYWFVGGCRCVTKMLPKHVVRVKQSIAILTRSNIQSHDSGANPITFSPPQ